jgi:predicted PurR-regulated permease PerM
MKPALIGEKTKLPYFLLFFGILGGIKLYGLLGMFIAHVILSLLFAVIKIDKEKYWSLVCTRSLCYSVIHSPQF